ncbi:MAG: alpha/beta hydrolase [Casimicrobiaceae bacterium]
MTGALRFAACVVLVSAISMLGGCSVFGLVNAFVPRGTYVAHADIAYGSQPRQALDLYVPRSAAPVQGYPVVVFFYGGSWTTGERADYRFVGEALASAGIVAVLADYRLYPAVSYPDFLRDSAAALAWTVRHTGTFGGDRTRVYVMGHSAGGYNAAMLALDSRWLNAEGLSPSALKGWIGLAGPYDFLPSGLADVQRVFHHPDYPPGGQPIEHVTSSVPRTFLGAAIDDTVVSPTRSTQQLANKLRAAGVDVTLKLYKGVGHGTLAGSLAYPLRWLAPVRADVVAFIRADGASAQ